MAISLMTRTDYSHSRTTDMNTLATSTQAKPLAERSLQTTLSKAGVPVAVQHLMLSALSANLERAGQQPAVPVAAQVPLGRGADGLLPVGKGLANASAPQPLPSSHVVNKPSAEYVRQLTADLREATAADDGFNESLPLPDAPNTLNPLQRRLLHATRDLPDETLTEHPELSDAVQDAYATVSGQRLGLSTRPVDPRVVGDLSQPRRKQLSLGELLSPKMVVQLGFHFDPSLPSAAWAETQKWVEDKQKTSEGRAEVTALLKGPVVKIEPGVRTFTPMGGFAVVVQPDDTLSGAFMDIKPVAMYESHGDIEQWLKAWLDIPVNLRIAADIAVSEKSLIDRALKFDASISQEARNTLRVMAENSVTFRNVLLFDRRQGQPKCYLENKSWPF